jgi:hypothetical protein
VRRIRFRELCAGAAIIAPAVAVVPLAGIDPGAQASIKLTALAVAIVGLGFCVRVTGPLSGVERCLTALAVLAFGSVLVTDGTLTTALPVVGGFASLTLLAWLARRTLIDRWSVIEIAVVASVLLVGACALLEMLGAQLPWGALRRPASTLGNRNHVAQYLAIAVPIVVAAASRGRRIAYPALVLAITVIVVARCRSAYLATACALFASLFLANFVSRRSVAAIALGLALGLLPWPGVSFAVSVADATGRVLAYDQGSAAARVQQHEVALAAFVDRPLQIGLGFGAGTWEDVASTYAHADGGHAPRFTGAAVPNSELLRIATEQGAVGLGLVALALVLVVRRLLARRDGARIATLLAACVCGLFDPLLVRPECVALLGIVIGCSAEAVASQARQPAYLCRALAAMLACAAMLRAASFVISSPRAMAGRVPGSSTWERQIAIAAALGPRPALDEKRALAFATRRRCVDAERALTAFVSVRAHHWGARVAVARCHERIGSFDGARRVWLDARAIEPHIFTLATSPTKGTHD